MRIPLLFAAVGAAGAAIVVARRRATQPASIPVEQHLVDLFAERERMRRRSGTIDTALHAAVGRYSRARGCIVPLRVETVRGDVYRAGFRASRP